MTWLWGAALLLSGVAVEAPQGRAYVVLVLGAGGDPEYAQMFAEQRDRIEAACREAGVPVRAIHAAEGRDGASIEPKQQMREAISQYSGDDPLWLILLGHGTFDGQTARFNLRGPDVAAAELGEWLAPLEVRVAVVNCASSSAPFINALSGPDRVVVTATRSGYEHNLARFGEYFSRALVGTQADLDKDEQVSLLEAFLFASRRAQEFYANENRLATEHALLDDNGDRRGTPADWFRGVRVVKEAKESDAAPDGASAHQLHLVPSARERAMSDEAIARRNALERELETLRLNKAGIPEDAYYRRVEAIAIELAKVYDLEKSVESSGADTAQSETEASDSQQDSHDRPTRSR